MLRPERMSRVSVAGSKRVLDDVIETTHDLHLLHVAEYDGSWEGFEPGDPIEGADEVSGKLVTIRSLENILDVDAEDAGPERIVTDEAITEELERVRRRVNELDDRRDELENERRTLEERLETMETLETLGIDLDLLGGYETLSTRVGEGNPEEVRGALADADGVRSYEVFDEGRVLAAFARPEEGVEDPFEDALVGVEFTPVEVPDAEGSPNEYATALRERHDELGVELEEVEGELATVRSESGDFLLATEEYLSIDVQKREIPLSFATTENAFVAEGWVPTERYGDFVEALYDDVGDHIEIDELERASYDGEGHVTDREPVEGPGAPEPTADGGTDETRTDGGRATTAKTAGTERAAETEETEREEAERTTETAETATDLRPDGGHASADSNAREHDLPMDTEPPVVQDNPDPVRPFETLVRVINRPKYSEFDPSLLVFLTFPVFFGFMIGDVGYGIVYMAIGYAIYSRYDGAIGALGAIALWAGGFTVLFGILYGEIFGLHTVGEVVWSGHPPMEKGLSPAQVEFAQVWLIVSLLLGLLHVTAGYVLGFAKNLQHGVRDAVIESGSWLMLMLGVWTWIFSESLAGSKPEFLFHVFDGEPLPFGFAGFPAIVGEGALVVAVVGLVLMIVGEVEHMGTGPGVLAGALESLNVLVNILSYARIAAVLLAKAGMAFVVNLLFFGAYIDEEGAFHFLIDHGPQYGAEHGEVMFEGLIHAGIGGILLGVVVMVVGHVLVLLLGITSAGLQAVRLEYVEFFQKFYEGGGEAYRPFGYDRQYTTEE